ncbi:MAG: glycosyltransferase family 9 protein [Verrucomicrobiales bacterium]|nr:glycosyltransferase family 9 protein [Verrucomicrobiales bacterium]
MPSSYFDRTRNARKILVVDLGFLGDSVHLVPACWELRRNYPNAELHTLSAVVGSELLALVPCVDRAWAYPLTNPSPPWWKHLDILRAIRRERFDVALSFSGGDRPVLVTALSGACHRLAHDNGRSHFYNPWLVKNWVPRQRDDLPVFEQRRKVLEAAGLTLGPVTWDLRVADDPETRALCASLGPRCVHLSLSSNTDLNDWPVASSAEFVEGLLGRGAAGTVALTSGAGHREATRLEEFFSRVRDPCVRRLPLGMPLGRLAAVLKHCSAHFGPDSGVLHLASALGVPTVATFRERGGWRQWIPTSVRHRTLSAPCPCSGDRRGDCAARGQAGCLKAITVGQALDALGSVLSGPSVGGTA